MEAARRPWRRIHVHTFSLRSLLVVFALVAVPLAGHTNGVHRRRWAVELLESWNMSVVGGYHPFDEMRPIFWEGHVRPSLTEGTACQYIGSWQMRLRTCERDPMLPASDAEVES